MTWFYNKLPQSTKFQKHINLYNPKNNHGPEHDPIGMVVDITQGEHGQMEELTFTMKNAPHEVIIQDALKPSKAQELLVWHFSQQRLDDETGKMVGVIPLTYKEMEKGTGMAYGTISSIVGTKNTHWWEKITGSHQWILSPQGMEDALILSSFLSSGEKREGS